MTKYEDRELVIRMKPVYFKGDLSHWSATIEFDGEQVYEETGLDLRDAGDRIYSHVWKDDTVISPAWRDQALPWPDVLNGLSPTDWD